MKFTNTLCVSFLALVPSVSTSSSLRGLSTIGNDFGVNPLPLVACDTDDDCPEIQCIMAPCDSYTCDNDGFCNIVSDRNDDPPSESNSTLIETGVPCGSVQCGKEEVCCNESCGTCTPVGGVCTEMFCADEGEDVASEGQEDVGAECGSATCSVGDVCCNSSCEICTPVGGSCDKRFCDIPEDAEVDPEEEDVEGSWALVTRGECDCKSLCSVCEKFLGICLQLYCFN